MLVQRCLKPQRNILKHLKDANLLIARDPDVTQWMRFKADILKKLGREHEAKEVIKRADALEMSGK